MSVRIAHRRPTSVWELLLWHQSEWIAVNNVYPPDLKPYHQEETDFIPSFESLRHARSLRRMPVVILVSDQPYNLEQLAAEGRLPPGIPVSLGPVFFRAHVAGQKQLARRLHATLILNTHAGHYIQTEQPQLVLNSIRHVVDQVRGVPDPKGLRLAVPTTPGGGAQSHSRNGE